MDLYMDLYTLLCSCLPLSVCSSIEEQQLVMWSVPCRASIRGARSQFLYFKDVSKRFFLSGVVPT
jgi:hypothetical protein